MIMLMQARAPDLELLQLIRLAVVVAAVLAPVEMEVAVDVI